MQKLNNTLKIIGVLIVLAIFWLFYFTIQIAYGTPENGNHNYIPENSNLVIAFNGDLAVKSVLSDFFSSQDEALLEKLNSEKAELKESTGINFLSDIILFKVNQDNQELSGLLFNLTSEKDFKVNFEGSIIAFNENVGLLLFDLNITKSKEKLKSIAKKIIANKTELYNNELFESRIATSHISLWTRNEVKKTDWKYAQLSINRNKININGELVLENIESNKTTQINDNFTSFNISTSQFPKQFGDTILSFIGVKNNQIIGVSSNYRSTKIEQENSFELVPDADFIYQLKNDASIVEILSNLELKELISKITPTDFTFGGKRFNYKQIDSKTIYIGRTDFKNVAFKNSTSLISINGAPNYLTKIEGNSLIVRLISIFPAYRFGSSLSNSIKMIDLNVDSKSTDVFKIDGSIEFDKDKYANIELIRNLFELRQ